MTFLRRLQRQSFVAVSASISKILLSCSDTRTAYVLRKYAQSFILMNCVHVSPYAGMSVNLQLWAPQLAVNSKMSLMRNQCTLKKVARVTVDMTTFLSRCVNQYTSKYSSY